MFRPIAIGFLTLLLMACGAKTRIKGYTDPAYQGHTAYSSTVVFASDFGFEGASNLESTTCRVFAGYHVACRAFHEMFPPTRAHQADEVFEALKEQNISSILILSNGGGYSSNNVFAYQGYGTAYSYGGQTTAYTTTVPMSVPYRASSVRATFIDVSTRETAWIGDAQTEGKGLLNVTDSSFVKSIAKNTVVSLVRARLVTASQ